MSELAKDYNHRLQKIRAKLELEVWCLWIMMVFGRAIKCFEEVTFNIDSTRAILPFKSRLRPLGLMLGVLFILCRLQATERRFSIV